MAKVGAGLPALVTNQAVSLVSAGVAAVGVVLLWASSRETGTWAFNDTWQAVVSNIGGLLVASALLATVWDLVGRRHFAREVMAQARVGADVARAGIVRVTNQYLEDVAWAELIDGATKVDIVVAYANTWRNHHRDRLARVASRSGSRVRVFLPDPDDAHTMSVLSGRFGSTVAELQTKVREAIREYSALAAAPGSKGGVLEVYLSRGDRVFSCYRFDGRAVLTLYSHSQSRRSVPGFVVGEGDLWDFVYDETNAIRAQSRKVFP